MITTTYNIHVGDDYLEITTPEGMVLTARHPDEADIQRAAEMIAKLNEGLV